MGAADLVQKLEKQTPAFYKWAQAVVANKHVLSIWDEETVIEKTKKRFAAASKV